MKVQEEENPPTFLDRYKIYIIGLAIIVLIAALSFIYFKYIYIEKPATEETVEEINKTVLQKLTAPEKGRKIQREVLNSLTAP